MHRIGIFARGIVLTMLLSAATASHAAQPIEVTVYSDDSYPPYSYAEKGEAKGIYPEIFRKAFAQMPQYHVDIKPVPWKRGLRMLETGEGFALFPPYFRPKERPFMKYSAPVLSESVAVFCSSAIADRVSRTRWPDDYYGLRFGINAGFSLGGESFDQAVKNGQIILDQASGNHVNLEKLILQRIDCYINDRYSILWEWRHINEEGLNRDGAKIVETATVAAEQGYLGYTDRDNGRFPFKNDFVTDLNKIIENMRRTGEIQRITDRILEQ